MNKEFLGELFDEVYNVAFVNNQQATLLTREILKKHELITAEERTKLVELDTLEKDSQSLVIWELKRFFLETSRVFLEVQSLEGENKAQMVEAMKRRLQIIENEFRLVNEGYLRNKKEYNRLFDTVDKMNRKVFLEIESLEAEREILNIEINVEVIFTISGMLLDVEKFKNKVFSVEKKTPEEVI